MHNFMNHAYPALLSTARIGESAGSTDYYTPCIDTRGYEGVLLQLATRTCGDAAFTAYAQMSATSSADGTFYDVYGSTVSHTTGFNAQDALLVIDVYRPKYRWVRAYVDRGATGEVINAIVAQLYHAHLDAPGFSTARGVSDVNIVVGTSS